MYNIRAFQFLKRNWNGCNVSNSTADGSNNLCAVL